MFAKVSDMKLRIFISCTQAGDCTADRQQPEKKKIER